MFYALIVGEKLPALDLKGKADYNTI